MEYTPFSQDELLHKLRVTRTLDEDLLNGMVLKGASLPQLYVHKSTLRNTSLEDAELSQCSLIDSVGKGASFRGARMQESSFERCRFLGTDLNQAVLEGSTLNKCHFDGSALMNVKGLRVSFLDCKLINTELHAAKLPVSRFLHVTFQLGHASMMRADLRQAFFIDCDMKDLNLNSANLEGAVLINCDLTGANLTGANLRRASFIHCKLYLATLDQCDLVGLIHAGTAFDKVSDAGAKWQ